jgi:hypothetical protein
MRAGWCSLGLDRPSQQARRELRGGSSDGAMRADRRLLLLAQRQDIASLVAQLLQDVLLVAHVAVEQQLGVRNRLRANEQTGRMALP